MLSKLTILNECESLYHIIIGANFAKQEIRDGRARMATTMHLIEPDKPYAVIRLTTFKS